MTTTFTIRNSQVLANCLAHLSGLNPNKVYDVEIREQKKKRSNPQNAMYWKWCSIIGKDLGYTKDEMHEAFASKFLGMVERQSVFGQQIIEPVSTTSLTTEQFTEYLTKIDAFAMSQEIKLPRPEYYGF